MVADCDLLIPYLGKLPKLQWVQSTWAGLDYLNPFIQDKQFDFILSRFSDKSFGLAMSEYVITQIVNFERDQKQQYENQKNSDWITDGKIKNHRLIRDLNIGILGLGNIGKFSKNIYYCCLYFLIGIKTIKKILNQIVIYTFYSCTTFKNIWGYNLGNDTHSFERTFGLHR